MDRLPTREEIDRLFNFDDFLNWVRKFSPSSVIGLTRNATSCPLAKFAEEKMPEAVIFVSVSNLYVAGGGSKGEYYPMSQWVSMVRGMADGDTMKDEEVTAERMREILIEVGNRLGIYPLPERES